MGAPRPLVLKYTSFSVGGGQSRGQAGLISLLRTASLVRTATATTRSRLPRHDEQGGLCCRVAAHLCYHQQHAWRFASVELLTKRQLLP